MYFKIISCSLVFNTVLSIMKSSNELLATYLRLQHYHSDFLDTVKNSSLGVRPS